MGQNTHIFKSLSEVTDKTCVNKYNICGPLYINIFIYAEITQLYNMNILKYNSIDIKSISCIIKNYHTKESFRF